MTIRYPAGLTFISDKDEQGRLRYQNGLTVSDIYIIVAAGLTQSFLLDLYCLNSSRSRPAGGVSFNIGPETENKGMRKLIEQLKNKNIRNDQVGKEWVYVSAAIQQAI